MNDVHNHLIKINLAINFHVGLSDISSYSIYKIYSILFKSDAVYQGWFPFKITLDIKYRTPYLWMNVKWHPYFNWIRNNKVARKMYIYANANLFNCYAGVRLNNADRGFIIVVVSFEYFSIQFIFAKTPCLISFLFWICRIYLSNCVVSACQEITTHAPVDR